MLAGILLPALLSGGVGKKNKGRQFSQPTPKEQRRLEALALPEDHQW